MVKSRAGGCPNARPNRTTERFGKRVADTAEQTDLTETVSGAKIVQHTLVAAVCLGDFHEAETGNVVIIGYVSLSKDRLSRIDRNEIYFVAKIIGRLVLRGVVADWFKNGHMEEAVSLVAKWCESHKPANATLEVVRIEERTPLIFIEVPGTGTDTVLLYGHLDKQPEMTGWRDGLGPWQPVHRLRQRVEELLRHDPDLVLLTGDFLTMEGNGTPGALAARSVEWISPQTVTLRDPDSDALAGGRRLGRAVIDALGYRDGFTHMEWFLTPEGEAVFGEIGARPPGARSVETMNYACDIDAFSGWAEAVVHGRLSQPVERRYNSAIIFKRAQGRGRIRRISGLESLLTRFHQHVVSVELLPPGAPRRNWKNTLLSDGWVIVRHPHLPTLLYMADRFGTDLQLHAE